MSDDPTFELDHIFVCASVGAADADRLASFGFTEAQPFTHHGQGTAGRYFFFCNTHLEFLWVHDDQEASAPETARTRLLERWTWRADTACPFGFCMRPTDAAFGAPFDAWQYAQSYLPKSWSLYVANNSDNLTEPMLFYLAGIMRPDRFPERYRQPLEHPSGVREITNVRWLRPAFVPLSREMNLLIDAGVISIGDAPAHALEIRFDDARQGKTATLQPLLPVSLFW